MLRSFVCFAPICTTNPPCRQHEGQNEPPQLNQSTSHNHTTYFLSPWQTDWSPIWTDASYEWYCHCYTTISSVVCHYNTNAYMLTGVILLPVVNGNVTFKEKNLDMSSIKTEGHAYGVFFKYKSERWCLKSLVIRVMWDSFWWPCLNWLIFCCALELETGQLSSVVDYFTLCHSFETVVYFIASTHITAYWFWSQERL